MVGSSNFWYQNDRINIGFHDMDSDFQIKKKRPKAVLYQVEDVESDGLVGFFQQRNQKILKTKAESYKSMSTSNGNYIEIFDK